MCADRDFLCTHLSLDKTLVQPTVHQFKYITELPAPAVLGKCANYLCCATFRWPQYPGQFHFHLTFASFNPPFAFPKSTTPSTPDIQLFFLSPQLSASSHKVLPAFLIAGELCPLLYRLRSQSIIDRYPRRGFLNSLRLAWFTSLRRGWMSAAIKNALSIRCFSMEVDH